MRSECHEVVMRQAKLLLSRMNHQDTSEGFYNSAKTMAEVCALLNSVTPSDMSDSEFVEVVEFLVKSWCSLVRAMDLGDVRWRFRVALSCDLLLPRVILLMGLCHGLIWAQESLADDSLIAESLRVLQEEMHAVKSPVKHLSLQFAFYSQVCSLDQVQHLLENSSISTKFLTDFALVQFANANALLINHKRALLTSLHVVFEDDPVYDQLVDMVVCQSIFLLARLSLSLEEYRSRVLPFLLRNIVLSADDRLQERLLKQIITCFDVSKLQIPTLESVFLASFPEMHPQLQVSDLMIFLLRSFLDVSDQSVGVVHFEELWRAVRSMKKGSDQILALSSLLQFQLTRRPVNMDRIMAIVETVCQSPADNLHSICQMVVDGVPKSSLERPLKMLVKAQALSYESACTAIERIETIEDVSLVSSLLEYVQVGLVDLKKQSWDQVALLLRRFSHLIGRMKPFATLQVFGLLGNLDFVSQCILIRQWLPSFYDRTDECATVLRGILKMIASRQIQPVLSFADLESRLFPDFEDLSLEDSKDLGFDKSKDASSAVELLKWYLNDSQCLLASDLLLQLNVPIGVFEAVVECLLVFEEQCTDSRTQIELLQRIISFLGKCELSVADASSLCMRILRYRRRLLRSSDASRVISLLMQWILKGAHPPKTGDDSDGGEQVVDLECAEHLVEASSSNGDAGSLLLAVRILEVYGPSAVMGNVIFRWIQRLDADVDENMSLVYEIWSRVGALSRPTFEVTEPADEAVSCGAFPDREKTESNASYFETFCDPDASNGFQ